MKDDYLWDRSGEPDPDVQSLESILGNLRHKGRAPVMPAGQNLRTATVKPRSIFFRPLLAAAAVLLVMFALGLWLAFNRQQTNQPQMVREKSAPGKEQQSPSPENPVNEIVSKPESGSQQIADNVPPTSPASPRRHKPGQRRSGNKPARNNMNQEEMAEGMLAKERLIQALQITSSKLNIAKKKARSEKELDPPS